MEIVTCTSCRAGVCNDDWSHLDFYHSGADADREHARITARLDSLGYLAYDRDIDEGEDFTCGVCGCETDDGGGVFVADGVER